MSNTAAMIREFHAVFLPDDPGQRVARRVLHAEEFVELDTALKALDQMRYRPDADPSDVEALTMAVARELADCVYVAYGTALEYDIELDVAIAEVHRANMSKGRRCETCAGTGIEVAPAGVAFPECEVCGGKGVIPVLRDDGKVLKGPGFAPPDMKGAVARG